MNKIIFWIGLGVFILGVLCFFLSGSTSGPSPEESAPTVPFLYGTSQALWAFLAIAGVIALVVGAFLKKIKK